MRPRKTALGLSVSLALSGPQSYAQTFNFNFGSAGSVVPSIANQTCGSGGGTMGGMGGGGNCTDGTNFMQELTSIGGNQYYHIVVGSKGADFGIEYYIRTVSGSTCWYGCTNARAGAGMGGMMGGGLAPLSSSAGAGGLSGNNNNPLASSNNGVAAPDRTAVYQYNRSTEMTQEFLKATESKKPKITQAMTLPGTSINFAVDMSNSDYKTMGTAGAVSLTQTVSLPGVPASGTNPATGQPLPSSSSFDIKKLTATAEQVATAGRYTYAAGSGDGGSLGKYTYFADSFDVYSVNWASYCDPAQNTVSDCTNYGGNAGGMMGGGGGGGGMGGGM